jgi:O-antigen/teichoic acid export membrane protein
LFGSILEGNRDFKRSAIFGIILNIIPALLILGAIAFYSNPVVFFAAYLLGNIGAGLLLSYLTYRIYRPSGDVGPDIQHLSKHFTLMNLLSTISQQIDKLLVFHFLGAAQLAVYAFAIAMPEQIKAISSSISTLAFPKFAVKSAGELKDNFWRRLVYLILFMSVVAVVYILLSPMIFNILFPAYSQSVIYSQVFALSLIIVANVMPITLLQAHAAKRELYIFNIAYPIFQIGTLIILIPLYGIMGAVAARILARAFNLILGSLLVRGYFEKIV